MLSVVSNCNVSVELLNLGLSLLSAIFVLLGYSEIGLSKHFCDQILIGT